MSSSQKGFTLAEVLIALALLGVVAAFTIPKVLQSTGNAEAIAKVKETVGELEEAWYAMKMNGTYMVGQNLYTSLMANTNANAPQFNTVTAGSGSITAAGAPYASVTNHPCVTPSGNGFMQFPNGVVIAGLGGAVGVAPVIPSDLSNGGTRQVNYVLCIDTNGASGANAVGTDVFVMNFNAGGTGTFTGGAPTATTIQGKNFFYGDTTNPVMNAAGAAGVSIAPTAGGTAAALTAASTGNVYKQLLN